MTNRYFKIVMFFVTAILLIASLLSLIKDVNFFITKKNTTAQVLSIEDLGVLNPYKITLKYFNENEQKDIVCNVNLKKSYGNELKEKNSSFVEVHYARGFPYNVYLIDYKTPRVGIILFDIILVILMTIAVLAYKDVLKKF